MAEKTYVYRLEVTYPEGSLEYGWAPDGWAADYNVSDNDMFVWPRNTLCLARQTARRRKKLLEKYGATVVVHRSEPVTWDG